MTAQDLTYLGLIVDRSGSMTKIRYDAEGGLREFVREQRELPGRLMIGMWEFDDVVDEVEDIDHWNLLPRGMTALLDAIGEAVVAIGERLEEMPEDDRPDKVVVVIVTDGLENSSEEWTRPQVFARVTEQQTRYKWRFVFLAAGQDAIHAGHSIGLQRANSSNFTATGDGVRRAYDYAGASVSSFRSGLTDTTVMPDHA